MELAVQDLFHVSKVRDIEMLVKKPTTESLAEFVRPVILDGR
jgi:hypothetical protein